MKIFLSSHFDGESVSFTLRLRRQRETVRRNRVKLNC